MPWKTDRRPESCFPSHLSIPVDAVRAPAARFDLVRVQSPELQFFFEQGATYVGRVVEFARPATRKIVLGTGMQNGA